MVVEGVAVERAHVDPGVRRGGAQRGSGARQVGFEEHGGDVRVREGGLELDPVRDGGFDAGVGGDEAGDGEAVGVRQVPVGVVRGDELARLLGDGGDRGGHVGVELIEARQVGGGVGAVGGLAARVDAGEGVADDLHVGLRVVDVVPQVGVDVSVDVLAEDRLGQHVDAGARVPDEAEGGLAGDGGEGSGGHLDDGAVEVGALHGGGTNRARPGCSLAGCRGLVPAEGARVGGELDALGGQVDGDVCVSAA